MENQEPGKQLNRHYAVFLSYRHIDNRENGREWATWLHHLLEAYEIPEDLVGTKNSKGDLIPANLYPVFRDEEELPADANLTWNLRHALENSDLLVVLCSPVAVVSRFVADEIRYFKELGKSQRILAIMIYGEPNASDDPGKAKLGIKPEAECLPEPLRYGVAGNDGKIDWSLRTEPIAADARPEGKAEQGWTNGAAYREALHKAGGLTEKEIKRKVHDYEQRLELAKLKVVAGAIGVPLGILTERDKAMQLAKARHRARTLRRWLGAVAALAVLAVAGGVFAMVQRQAAVALRKVAEGQRKEALETASATDFAIAGLKIEKADWPAALAYLADALRKNPQNQSAMALAVSAIRNLPVPVAVIRQTDPVDSASYSPDGKRVLTVSKDGARIWDTHTGQPVGQPMKGGAATLSPDGQRVVTLLQDNTVHLWDAGTGLPEGQPIKPGGNIKSAVFSPEGSLVVTESDDRKEGYTMRLWDTHTGQPVGQPLQNWTGEGSAASVSPDGQWALTVFGDATQVWNARTGQPVGQLMKHDAKIDVMSASFSPDSKRVLIALADDTAQLWNAQTGLSIGQPMKGGDKDSFSPDGRWVLTVSYDTARVWDAQTGAAVGQPIKGNATGNVFSASFTPNSKWVMMALTDNTTRFWDAATGDTVGQPLSHKDETIFSMDFNPACDWVVSSSDQTAQIRETETGRLVGMPIQHTGIVYSASFSPDGRYVMTRSDDNSVRIWQVPASGPVGMPVEQDGIPSSANFSPDGKLLLMETSPGKQMTGSVTEESALVFDARTGQPVGQPMQTHHILWYEGFSPDSKRVLTVSQDSTGQVWDAQTGLAVGKTMQNMQRAFFSPDNKQVLSVSKDDTAHIWDAQTGLPVGKPMKGGNFAGFSPDGERVVTVAKDNTAQLWDAQTVQAAGQPIKGAAAVCFSPDSKYLLAALGNTARLWDVQTGQPVGQPMKQIGSINPTSGGDIVKFSPDGKKFLVNFGDTAGLWDTQTGQPAGQPMKQNMGIASAEFSLDGKYLVTTGDDMTAQVWDSQTGRAIGQLMKHDHRISSAFFTPDSRWVVTKTEDDLLRFWDVQTGQMVNMPVQSIAWVSASSFSPDGHWVALVSRGNTRLWHPIVTGEQAPPWLADLAEIMGGKRLNAKGVLEPTPQDPAQLRGELQKLGGDDDFSCFGRWIASDPATRTLDPFSKIPTPDYLAQLLRDNTVDLVEEAYRIDPGDPVTMASLATFGTDQVQALFLCRRALKIAQLEGPPEKIGQVQAIAKSLFPDLPEFGGH